MNGRCKVHEEQLRIEQQARAHARRGRGSPAPRPLARPNGCRVSESRRARIANARPPCRRRAPGARDAESTTVIRSCIILTLERRGGPLRSDACPAWPRSTSTRHHAVHRGCQTRGTRHPHSHPEAPRDDSTAPRPSLVPHAAGPVNAPAPACIRYFCTGSSRSTLAAHSSQDERGSSLPPPQGTACS